MRGELNKKKILEAAAKMADENGFASITLVDLASRLGVKPPSLYKHISGLEELNEGLMLYGWELVDHALVRCAVGKAKDDAIIAICNTYRSFVLQHKGLFEAMQWYNMYLSDVHLQATNGIVSTLFQVLDAYGLSENQKVHIVRMLRGMMQGFLSIESHGGYGNAMPVDESFDFAVKTLLGGIHELQEEV